MVDQRGQRQVESNLDGGDLVALLEGLARGDRAAAGRFFDRYEAEVNRIVWTLLGADSEHDDIVHDAFQSMFRGAHAVKSVAALRGWIRAVTVNAVRQELRRRRWRRLFSPEEEGLDHPDLRVPDEDARERARAMYRTLAGLGGEDRMVLLLRHVEGYELTELAEAMGCSLATVKRWLSRAEARLGAALEVGGAS